MSEKGRVVITGGAGFLGSHMCDRLIAEEHEVRCMDNLLTGGQDNIQHLTDHPRFTFIQADVTQPLDVEGPVDFVLHLASPASPRDYTVHPIHTLKVGALGSYNALGLARAKGAVFLLASTSEVYGDPEVHPQPESYWGHVNPVGPRSMYDEAKRFAEAIATAYCHQHGLEVRIARIFNTYGPRMRLDDGRVLPTLITQALRDEPLTVWGDGSQTRSFCYVDDLIEGLYRCMTFTRKRPRTVGQAPPDQEPGMGHAELIVNLGNPEEVRILDVAREVIEVTGSRSQIVFQPLPEDDPKVRRPDITRAKTLLGWEPRISRHEGLRLVVPYFQRAMDRQTTAAQGILS